jgi:hypothetical protein
MNYQKIYDSLIERAISETRKRYKIFHEKYIFFERHHIIPECFFKNRKRKGLVGWLDGDPDAKENLVLLKPEEHYVAHQLLVKIYPDNHRMIKAANRMTTGKYRNNKLYGWLRKRFSESMSGKNNTFYGKRHEPELAEEIRIKLTGKIRSESTKTKLSECKKGKPRSKELGKRVSETKKTSLLTRRMPISTPHGIFNSIIGAADFLNRDSATIIKKLNSPRYPEWFRLGNINRFKIQTPDGIFGSIKDAADYYNVTISTITNRCKKIDSWRKINDY